MKKIGIMFLLSGFLTSPFQDSGFPEAQISNGILTAHFYLPDIYNGYYRATRFDWSGNTISLDYKGHSYYGKWFDKYEPTIHDVVMGPVEEFGAVGISEAVSISFIQTLSDVDYGYTYKKTVRLIKGSPELVIDYIISNNGGMSIETSVYNHNFMMIDKEPTGPGYLITFPFDLSGECRGAGGTVRLTGNQLVFPRKLFSRVNIFCGTLQRFSKTEQNYN